MMKKELRTTRDVTKLEKLICCDNELSKNKAVISSENFEEEKMANLAIDDLSQFDVIDEQTEGKVEVEARYHRCKVCPNVDDYLQKVDSIPKYFDNCQPRFLSKNSFEKVVIASYPRSGTTLLRKYLESITKVITGSDSSTNGKIAHGVKVKGMQGEGEIDSRVWIVKTNFPERLEVHRFKAHKCILLVRNPIDAITSLFHMNTSCSINKSVSSKDLLQQMDIFEKFYNVEIEVWTKFYEFWHK